MNRGPFSSRAPRSPFDRPARRPGHLADSEGRIKAADEVRYLTRLAMAEWIHRHDLSITVDQLEARVLEVGSSVACAEALAGQMSNE